MSPARCARIDPRVSCSLPSARSKSCSDSWASVRVRMRRTSRDRGIASPARGAAPPRGATAVLDRSRRAGDPRSWDCAAPESYGCAPQASCRCNFEFLWNWDFCGPLAPICVLTPTLVVLAGGFGCLLPIRRCRFCLAHRAVSSDRLGCAAARRSRRRRAAVLWRQLIAPGGGPPC